MRVVTAKNRLGISVLAALIIQLFVFSASVGAQQNDLIDVAQNDIELEVGILTPEGDFGFGSFSFVVTCESGAELSASLAAGETAKLVHSSSQTPECSFEHNLTEAQAKLFDVTVHSTVQSSGFGILEEADFNLAILPEYLVVYAPKDVVSFEIDNRTERTVVDTFKLVVTCSNGDVHSFESTPGQTVSFEYDPTELIDCSLTQELTPEQQDSYVVTVGDEHSNSDGVIAAQQAGLIVEAKLFIENTPVQTGAVLGATDSNNSVLGAEDTLAATGVPLWPSLVGVNIVLFSLLLTFPVVDTKLEK